MSVLRLRPFTLALLVAGLLAPANAQAQPARPIAREGAWRLDCTPEPQTRVVWCQVGIRLDSLTPPYQLEFNYVRDSHMFFAMGTPGFARVLAAVDGQPTFYIERCLGGMCLIKDEPAGRLLKQMREGRTLTLLFEGAPLPGAFAVPLAGFEPLYRRALGLAN
jgi:invasion protein IalB